MRNDHRRIRRAAQINVAGIPYDADDLPGNVFELRAQAVANDDLLTKRILIWPERVRHCFGDEKDGWITFVVLLSKTTATQDRDFENIEGARRHVHPQAVARPARRGASARNRSERQ